MSSIVRSRWSGVEVALAGAVLGAMVLSVLRPERVAEIVSLTGIGASHPNTTLIALVAVAASVTCRLSMIWGPVRTDTATARWQLSGPEERAQYLRRPLAVTALVAIGVVVLMAAIVATLNKASLILLLVVGVAFGLAGIFVAYMEQLRRNRDFIADSRFTPNALHRRAIAPNDGLAGSVALALSMIDVSWLEGARAVRWQGSHQKTSAHAALPRTSLAAILVLELRRVYRRPDAAGRFV